MQLISILWQAHDIMWVFESYIELRDFVTQVLNGSEDDKGYTFCDPTQDELNEPEIDCVGADGLK